MKTIVNGKPVENLTERQQRRLSLVKARPAIDATIIDPEAAIAKYATTMKVFHGVLAAVLVVVFVGLIFVADPWDRIVIVPFAAALLVLMGFFMVFMYRRRVRKFSERMHREHSAAGSAGAAVHLDESGLNVSGKSRPWPSLAIDTVEMTYASGPGEGDTSMYTIDRLVLSATGESETIPLDASLLSNGRIIVDNVYRRLNQPTR